MLKLLDRIYGIDEGASVLPIVQKGVFPSGSIGTNALAS